MAKPTFAELQATKGALGFDPDSPAETTPVEVTEVATPGRSLPVKSDIEVEQEQAAADRVGNGEVFLASLANDNTLSRMDVAMAGRMYEYDETFDSIDYGKTDGIKQRLDALTMADPEDLGGYLGSARNAGHYELLLSRAEKEQEREQTIASAGARGMAVRLAANLVDPVDIAVTAAAAPLGAAAKINKAGRLARSLKGGATAAAANASVEGVVASQSPFRDESDVGLAAIIGFGLGGGLSSLSRAQNAEMAELAEAAAKRHIDSVGARRRELSGDQIEAPDEISLTQRERADRVASGDNAEEFKWATAQKIQANYIGRLLHSTNDRVREFGSSLLEGGVQRDLNKVRRHTAEGRSDHIDRVFENEFIKKSRGPFRAWSKENGYNRFRHSFTSDPGDKFFTEVTEAMRGNTNVSRHAQEAAKAIKPLADDYYKLAHASGMRGFEDPNVPKDFTVPRTYNKGKFIDAVGKWGEDGVATWFKEAIVKGADDIPEDVAEAMARGMTRSILNAASGVDNALAHGIPMDDLKELRKLLDEEEFNVVKSFVESSKESKKAGKTSPVRHGKRRVRLDELYEEGIMNPRTGEKGTLRLSDLSETDARKIWFRYSRAMSGHIGLAEEANIKGTEDFDAIKNQILEEARDSADPVRIRDAQREVDALDDIYKGLTGQDIMEDPFSTGAQWARLASSTSFIRFGGGFGWAQLPEIGNVMGFATLRTFARYMPEYTKMFKRRADGELSHDLARVSDQLFAPGTDIIRNPVLTNFDEFSNGFGEGFMGNLMKKIDPAMQGAARATAIFSGMGPIITGYQRVAAMQWNVRMSDWATGKVDLEDGSKAWTRKDVQRLRQAGIDEAMQERIFKSLRKAAVYEDGKLVNIDLNKWKDTEALHKYRLSGLRETRRMIQENDFGNTGRWVHHPLGRVMSIFMKFALNSVNKQLLQGVSMHDIQTWASWTASIFFGGLAYMGQTSLNFANDPEKLEERLDPKMIVAAAVQRAGFTAMLIPIVDSALTPALGMDPLFSHGRSSGQGTRFLDLNTNPAISGIINAGKVASLPIRLLRDDYSYSQADNEALFQLLPFKRFTGVQVAQKAIEDAFDLPKSSQ